MKRIKYICFLLSLLSGTSAMAQRLENTLEEPLKPGQTIEIGGKKYVAGVNILNNGGFEEISSDGTYPGWTSGTYQPLSSTYFTHDQNGGYDGDYSITATQNVGASEAGSIATRWAVTPYTKYYFSYQVKGLADNSRYIPVLTLTSINSTAGGQNEGVTESTMLIGATDYQKGEYGYSTYTENGSEWAMTALAFDTDKDVYLQFNARYLYAANQYVSFDDFRLMQLYPVTEGNTYETLKQIYEQRGQEIITFIQTLYVKYPAMYNEVAQEFAINILGLEEIPADKDSWLAAIKAQIPETEDGLQYMMTQVEDLYSQAKMDYNAAEAMSVLLVREKILVDTCDAHLDIIEGSTALNTLYNDAKDQYNVAYEWYNGEDKSLGQYNTYYNGAIEVLRPLTGVEAMIRLRIAIEAARKADTTKPAYIDGAEEYYNGIYTAEYIDADTLFSNVPTIDDWIVKLKKVWKIRIHMGTNVGTLAQRIAGYVEDFDEVECLLVTGMLNSDDSKTLGALKNLQWLDLSGITSMEIGTTISLRIDSMQNIQRPDIDLIHNGNTSGHFTFEGTDTLAIRAFCMNIDHYNGTTCSVINKGMVGAECVSIRYLNPSAKWDFVSFPFNVKVAEIKPLYKNQDICIRKYSGENRAAGDTQNTWIDVAPDETLEAGRGYIIQSPTRYTEQDEAYKYSAWEIPAIKDANMNNIFRKDTVTVELNTYATDDTFAHNRSWNLIGNPYASSYDISNLGFAGPVIVWDSNTYKTYTASDKYTFKPGEAFFVQRPVGDDGNVVFYPEARIAPTDVLPYVPAYYWAKRKARVVPQNDICIVLSDDTSQDETRVIISDEANIEYEIGTDAAKFMSPMKEVPQIYSHAPETNGKKTETVRFSVNERPLAGGIIKLGMYIPADGDYTITMTGGQAVIEDTGNGIFTELSESQPFNFSAKAGTYESRFVLHLAGTTGVEEIANTQHTIHTPQCYYNLSGQRISANTNGMIIKDGKKHIIK